MPLDVVPVSKMESLTIDKIELSLSRLAMLVSKWTFFLFIEVNKSANVVVGGVAFTECDIISFILSKKNRKSIYKTTIQGTQYKNLVI